jgi:prophage tail gpP-like protein
MLGDAIPILIEVQGWRVKEGVLWQPGQVISFFSPRCMFYRETELMIRDVTLKRSVENKDTTTLSCVLLETFLGEIPAIMPWEL